MEATSPSWLLAREGVSVAVLSISCSAQVQTRWKNFSTAPSSPGSCPGSVILLKAPCLLAGSERAEPASLASLAWGWSWWVSGPSFFLSLRVFAAQGQEDPLSSH